jgi:uncharacterized protein (DUF1697 family)
LLGIPALMSLPTPLEGGPRFVAMLRAINVGGRNRLSMRVLADLATGLGHREVVTHLQSGNLVFVPAVPSEEEVSRELAAHLSELGLSQVDVMVRSADEMATVARTNPLGGDPQGWHVTFLSEPPDPVRLAALDPLKGAPDRFLVVGRDVYLTCAGRYSDSVLTNSFLERRLGVRATTRNWATVMRLAELARASASQ